MNKRLRGLRGAMRGMRPSRSVLSVFVMILCVSIAMPTMVFAQGVSSPVQGDGDTALGVSGPEGLRTTGAALLADEQMFEWGGGSPILRI